MPRPPVMTCENDVKKQIRKIAKKYGCYDRASAASAFSRKGMPDRHMCCRGWFIGVEAKYANNWLSEAQAADLRAIRDAGGIALVINEKTLGVLELALRMITEGWDSSVWYHQLPQFTKKGYLEAR